MKKIVTLVLLLCLFTTICIVPVSATELPNDPYTYWLGYNEKMLVPTKAMYDMEAVLGNDRFGYKDLGKINDVYCDDKGNIYILEEQPSRLTIFDSEFNLTKTITAFKNESGEEFSFSP